MERGKKSDSGYERYFEKHFLVLWAVTIELVSNIEFCYLFLLFRLDNLGEIGVFSLYYYNKLLDSFILMYGYYYLFYY